MTAAATVQAQTAPQARRGRRARSIGPWIIFGLGFLYFFLPLLATFEFSLRACGIPRAEGGCSMPDFLAYRNAFGTPALTSAILYSFTVGIITIVTSLLIIVPTAYWVRLRLPRLRPVVEFVTLMPFVVPPVVLVFGLIRIYSGEPLALTSNAQGTNILLVGAYVVLSFPYMYRAVDTGLAAIDVRTLTEAAQSMGAGWGRIIWQIIFPNLRTALLSGAFLTLAIVLGEYTIGNFLIGTKTFGPYLSLLGQNKVYEPAAVSLVSFGITWGAMAMIALLGRGTRGCVQIAGAR
jgi:putative spermidine/putrescine transport system permease protein